MLLLLPWLFLVCLIRVFGKSWPWAVVVGTLAYVALWAILMAYYALTG